MVAVVAPLVLAAVMVVVLGNPTFALFAVLSPVVVIGTSLEQRRRRARARRDAERTYAASLAELERRLQIAAAAERARRAEHLVDLAEVARRAALPSSRVWERRPGAGWMQVRFGTGDDRWTPPTAGDLHDAGERARRLVEAAARIVDVAIGVDLDDGGVLGIVGPPADARCVARSVVLQAVVHHGPADLAVEGCGAHEHEWRWLRWLPHAAAVPGHDRLALVVVDDANALADRRSRARALLRGDGGRTALVVLAERDDQLPSTCGAILRLRGLGSTASLERAGTAHPVRLLADGCSIETARRVARSLASLDDPELPTTAAALPEHVGLLSVLGLLDADLCEALAERWRAAGADAPTAAVLGLGTGGRAAIDLVADGPHALIAGTTGAGKSELLRTLVAALAAASPPSLLTFLLIDFKGGSAFDACARLPHVVGLLTDLDAHLAARAMRSLEAELRHRERVLRAAGVSDLSEHRRLAQADPLPRLVVVVDEFATLRAELPEFVDALVDVAQRGRSLGVHLVLATQRPAGAVSESIRANTNLRICLRVQDAADSNDVVGSGLAATLPRDVPGRAVLRVGSDGLLSFQAALASTPAVRGGAAPLTVHGVGRRPRVAASTGPTELDELAAAATDAFRAAGGSPPRRPWIDPLPPRMPLADVLARAAAPGRSWAPFAVADDPDRQRRVVHGWVPEEGNLLLAGLAGSGTSSALLAVAVAIVARRPDDVHLYVVSSARGPLDVLEDDPHCGAVLRPGERERQARLARQLRAEVERRRRLDGAALALVPRVVVLVDGWGALVAEHADALGAVAVEDLTRTFADGPAVGVHTAVAVKRPGELPLALSSLVTQRLLFRLADGHDYVTAGARVDSLPRFVPGRAIDVASGREVQVGLVSSELLDPARRPASPPAPVGVLPQRVRFEDLPSARFAGRPWWLPLGIGERDLRAAGFLLHAGEHAVVAGPARSGRSGALVTIGRGALASGADVHVLAPARSPLRGLAGATGHEHAAGAVAAVRAAERPCLLLVDDAELVDDDDGSLGDLLTDPLDHVAVVAAGRNDALRTAYGHWTRGLRRWRTALLLQPDVDLDGELAGAVLPRRSPVPLGPGRGWLLGGVGAQVVQSALTNQEKA